MINSTREQKKMALVYRSQLHRLQLETKLLESRRPIKVASSFMSGAASWSLLGRLANHFAKVHPALGRLAQGLKICGVLLAVARILRS
jgi:hypothetical protein